MIIIESEYQKQTNESDFDYKLRLIVGKIDKIIDLDWEEIRDLLKLECSSDHLRKTGYGIYEYHKQHQEKLQSNIQDSEILTQIDTKRIEFEKSKYRFFDQRVAYNKSIRFEARWDELKTILLDSISLIKPYEIINYIPIENSDNDLLIGLNDIHFGIDIDNFWNKYNPEIAKLRFEQYLQEIITIQKTHKSENCYVCANGDLISGIIHYTIALANRENVVKQIMGVSELISWFLSELSGYFKTVNFSVVPGNHSRLSISKDSAPKDERLDDLIPFYIKARLQNLNNINIIKNCIDNTMSLINIRGLNYLGVHGDLEKIDNILKTIVMIPYKIYGILFGHLHHNESTFVQGYKVLMSGGIIGVDDYCIEKRLFSKPQQIVCVCDNSGVKATYDIIFTM